MIVTTKQLFNHAYKKYAIGAYNINNAEQLMGLFRGNIDSKAPFIIQISKGARQYIDKRLLEAAMIRASEEIFPEVIFAVHLDHGDEETCMDCIKSGFYSSVMIDGSHEPFDKNVEITKRVVEAAHERGISVEAELGKLGGVEEGVKGIDPSEIEEVFGKYLGDYVSGHTDRIPEKAIHIFRDHISDPEEAKKFIELTGADSLAVAFGSSHGAFKFKHKPILAMEVFDRITELVPCLPLVMHGSSSVPQDEVQRINAAGGKLSKSMGVPEDVIQTAYRRGVTKINIDTDGRLVWCRVHRESFRDTPENFDLRKPGKIFMDEYAKYIAQKNEILGSAGKLEDLRKALGSAK